MGSDSLETDTKQSPKKGLFIIWTQKFLVQGPQQSADNGERKIFFKYNPDSSVMEFAQCYYYLNTLPFVLEACFSEMKALS